MLALCMCTGCELGSYRDDPGTSGGQSQSGSDKAPQGNTGDVIDHPTETAYTVSLYLNNKPFYAEGISVFWRGTNTVHVAELGEDGQADAGELDGDFDVYLSGLPQGYAYDPNIYRATGTERHVDILIVEIKSPLRGDGGVNAKNDNDAKYQNGGCFVVSSQGTYSVSCEKDQILYFEYHPTTSGIYSVESWCNVYDDSINPLVTVYGGTVGYKYLIDTRDTGGAALDGGFTKNFRYEISVPNIGPTYTFGISAVSKTGEYPVTVEFAIVRDGDCAPSSTVVPVSAKEASKLDKPKPTDTYVYADDEGTFDSDNYYYDKKLGIYRRKDNGAYLCCDLLKMPQSYTLTSLYAANRVQESNNNFLKLAVIDDDGNYKVYDYTDFIRKSYYAKCDTNGRCYVTEELKEFLQLYAVNHNLWTDGVAPQDYMPEGRGYSASQEDLWLFACGYYI